MPLHSCFHGKLGRRPGFLFLRPAWTCLIAAFLAFDGGAGTAHAAELSPAKAEALARLLHAADSLKLADHVQWRKLLHFSSGKQTSDIDGGIFFLSGQGRSNPRAELAATLKAFLSDEDLSPPLEDTLLAVAAMHPLCKFRARLLFLQRRLNLPDSLLATADCSRYVRWREALKPKGASLIFASSYLNNPASTFGHTFLRIDTHQGGGSKSLLNYGITYAASVPPQDGMVFVYKGLFGRYRGTFSMVPYYVSLQKYSNLESRDIWEYDLALDSLGLEYLLGHIWEVGASWMEYYFFDENCSYNVITLLDAAVPEWDLARVLGYFAVVPAETVRLALERKGLVKSSRWRPSLLTAFRIKSDSLPGRQRAVLRDLIKGKSSPDSILNRASDIPPDSQATLVDVALDYVQYRKRRAEGKKADGWNERQRALLMARTGLPRLPERVLTPRRDDQPPEAGHGPAAIGIKAGLSHRHPFGELSFRFAYHDLNAAEAGFLPGSAIEALKIRLRLVGEREPGDGIRRVEIAGAELLNTLSLSAVDRLMAPLSWGVRIAYDPRPRTGGRSEGPASHAFAGEGGAGWSLDLGGLLRPFALGMARARYRPFEGHGADVGPLLRTGARLRMGEAVSVLGEFRLYHPLLQSGPREAGRPDGERDVFGELRLRAGRDADLRLGLSVKDGRGELALGWNGYF